MKTEILMDPNNVLFLVIHSILLNAENTGRQKKIVVI